MDDRQIGAGDTITDSEEEDEEDDEVDGPLQANRRGKPTGKPGMIYLAVTYTHTHYAFHTIALKYNYIFCYDERRNYI